MCIRDSVHYQHCCSKHVLPGSGVVRLAVKPFGSDRATEERALGYTYINRLLWTKIAYEYILPGTAVLHR